MFQEYTLFSYVCIFRFVNSFLTYIGSWNSLMMLFWRFVCYVGSLLPPPVAVLELQPLAKLPMRFGFFMNFNDVIPWVVERTTSKIINEDETTQHSREEKMTRIFNRGILKSSGSWWIRGLHETIVYIPLKSQHPSWVNYCQKGNLLQIPINIAPSSE